MHRQFKNSVGRVTLTFDISSKKQV